jgi:hypothetical protein
MATSNQHQYQKTVDWWVPETTVGPRGIVFPLQTDGNRAHAVVR